MAHNTGLSQLRRRWRSAILVSLALRRPLWIGRSDVQACSSLLGSNAPGKMRLGTEADRMKSFASDLWLDAPCDNYLQKDDRRMGDVLTTLSDWQKMAAWGVLTSLNRTCDMNALECQLGNSQVTLEGSHKARLFQRRRDAEDGRSCLHRHYATSSTLGTGKRNRKATTESRLIFEDVMSMSKSALTRRSKEWLVAQCNAREMDSSGQKELLVGRLLDWQLQELRKDQPPKAKLHVSPSLPHVKSSTNSVSLETPRGKENQRLDSNDAVKSSDDRSAVDETVDGGKDHRNRMSTPMKHSDDPSPPALSVSDHDRDHVNDVAGSAATISFGSADQAAAWLESHKARMVDTLKNCRGDEATLDEMLNQLAASLAAYTSSMSSSHTSTSGTFDTARMLVQIAHACHAKGIRHKLLATNFAAAVAHHMQSMLPYSIPSVLWLLALSDDDITDALQACMHTLAQNLDDMSPHGVLTCLQTLVDVECSDYFGIYMLGKAVGGQLGEFSSDQLVAAVRMLAQLKSCDPEFCTNVIRELKSRQEAFSSSDITILRDCLIKMGCNEDDF